MSNDDASDGHGAMADFTVKYGRETLQHTLPLHATLGELKRALATMTNVQVDKQRLLFNAPVVKERRRGETQDDLRIADLLPASLTGSLCHHDGAVPQHVAIGAMLLGTSAAAATPPMMHSKITSELSRLVSTTLESDGQWFRCCYGRGYLRQTAYVCRSCIEAGRADAAHALCLACAEMCHAGHEVEEWGVRNYMRCDCCTAKCWQRPTRPDAAPQKCVEISTSAKEDNNDGGGGGGAAAEQRATVDERRPWTVSTQEVVHRVLHKRSRSTSPPSTRHTRSRQNSPLSGLRVQPTSRDNNNSNGVSGVSEGGRESRRSPVSAPHVATHFPAAPGEHDGAANSTTAAGAKKEPRPSSASHETRLTSYSRSHARSMPPVTRCLFVQDSDTGRPPATALLPPNRKNRYPRNPLKWCYCEDDDPQDDPEYGGIACMLCTSCFWSEHITRLFCGQLRRVPCYGDVVQGDTLAFHCDTCNTYVCVACRYRCHKDHQCSAEPVTASREEGTDNGAPPGVNFSCGCRGLCSIAEAVPEDEVDDPGCFAPIPAAVARRLMNEDIFTGFICAHCMQEHPWLAVNDPLRCYAGRLPARRTEGIKPIVACAAAAVETSGEAYVNPDVAVPGADGEQDSRFSYHGMLLPANAFTAEATCRCEACRAAYDAFAPRGEEATDLVVQLHDQCDNCGASIKDRQAFLCVTCENTNSSTFFLCSDCNALRLRIKEQQFATQPASSQTACDNGNNNNNSRGNNNGDDAMVANGQVADAPTTATAGEPASGEAPHYSHDLTHEFLEDTLDNLYRMCGMQIMQSIDDETRDYLIEHQENISEELAIGETICNVFGQTPIEFSEEELKDFVAINKDRAVNAPAERDEASTMGDFLSVARDATNDETGDGKDDNGK